MHDYSEIRECMLRAHKALAEAHSIADEAKKNPISQSHSIRMQIDQAEQIVLTAKGEIAAIRSACDQGNVGARQSS